MRVASAAVALPFLGSTAQAATLTVSFPEVTGDVTDFIDLTGATLRFDSVTGDYQVILTATPANPFLGQFNVNINLFDASLGTMAGDPTFFSDTLNTFALGTPTTEITLTKTNARLTSWHIGDETFAHNFRPTGVDFVLNPSPRPYGAGHSIGSRTFFMQKPMTAAR